MLGRYWLRYVVAGAVVVGPIGPTIWGVNQLRWYHAEHANERVSASLYKYDSADGVVIKCLDGVDAPSFAEGIVCLAGGIEANRRAKRSEYDLKAQQDMAEWAYGILLISAFGLIVITVGVLVVLQSLRLARQTVDRAGDANALSCEAMIADQRAWITSKLIIRGDLEFFEGRAFIEVAARYQNIGKTPAIRVHTALDMVLHDAVDTELEKLCSENRFNNSSSGRIVLPREEYDRAWYLSAYADEVINNPNPDGFIMPRIIGCVTYEILPDHTIHQTVFVYFLHLGEDDGVMRFIPVNQGNISKDEIEVAVDSGGSAD